MADRDEPKETRLIPLNDLISRIRSELLAPDARRGHEDAGLGLDGVEIELGVVARMGDAGLEVGVPEPGEQVEHARTHTVRLRLTPRMRAEGTRIAPAAAQRRVEPDAEQVGVVVRQTNAPPWMGDRSRFDVKSVPTAGASTKPAKPRRTTVKGEVRGSRPRARPT